jgi:hypothetical protein
MFLPPMMPARRAPVPSYVVVISSVVLLLCVTASVLAMARKPIADRIAGVVAGLLTGWMIYAFYNAI